MSGHWDLNLSPLREAVVLFSLSHLTSPVASILTFLPSSPSQGYQARTATLDFTGYLAKDLANERLAQQLADW